MTGKEALLTIYHCAGIDYNNELGGYADELRVISEDLDELERIKSNHKWCEGCKEYDKENSCCHRFSHFIGLMYNENFKAVEEENAKLKKALKIYQDIYGYPQSVQNGNYCFIGPTMKLGVQIPKKDYELLKEIEE